MKCSKCGHENRTGAKFCEECAAPLPRVCPNCDSQVATTAKFCPECAHPNVLAGESLAAARFMFPASYTPKHLAQKILTSKATLEGERKQVTVLFADLKGSMELLADRDPEEAHKLLDPVLDRMMEAVHRYEGTVNQVMGDGIMALFGAPVAHEDHAVRACYAALDMQAAIRRYAEEARRSHGISLAIRVGLNSGEVLVRAIGSDLQVVYTAVGQTTHLAARMEQLATGGTSLLTADTLRLAEGFIEVKPLGPVPVKGLEALVEVYDLIGAGTVRTRLYAAAVRGLTQFVGREGELKQLWQALGQTSGGHGQVVAIAGEPGVGKSRLVWEVTHSHRVHGWLVLQASSVSYGRATSYLPVIDLLKTYFAIEDRDGPRAMREKLTGKLLTLDRAQESSLPALLSLLDVPTNDPLWEKLDPLQRRRLTQDAVKRLLLRESQVQPLLIVFEDLHWIDSETLALLDGLVDSLSAARLLLLVNYRPGYQHPWGSRTYYTQLRLDPLPMETAEQFLGALLGTDAGFDALKRMLIARTEGNPFFLEESVRALVETGALSGERGAYRLARPVLTVQVPTTVQAVLAARIDRLPSGDKAILQMASVIGKDVPFVLLKGIAEHAENELYAAIGRLQAAEFLRKADPFTDLEYTFNHALTQDVAYGSLVRGRRRTLHSKIIATIETLYADRLAEHIDRLAHHAIRGEAWEKAVIYLRQAGAKSAARSAYREAVVEFEDALDALRHAPESRERTEQAIDLHLNASGALLQTGARTKSLDHADEARALAEALGDKRRLAWVLVSLSNRAWLAGDPQRALDVGERARTIAMDLGDILLQARVNWVLGLQRQTKGEYRRAVELLGRTVDALKGKWLHERFESEPATLWIRTRVVSVSTLGRLAWCLAELGEFTEALTRGEEAVRIALEVDDAYSIVFAYRSLGFVLLRRGDISQSISPLERGVELCRAAQVVFPFDIAAGHLGYAYALFGRLAEGVSLIEEALADPVATGTSNHPLLMAYLGEAHLLAGRIDEAIKVGRRALDLAHRQQERGSEAWVLHLLGEIAAHADPPELALAGEQFTRALALAEELGMRPLVAHCHLGLSKLHQRKEQRQQAQAHHANATAMYREMNMQMWLQKAAAEMRQME